MDTIVRLDEAIELKRDPLHERVAEYLQRLISEDGLAPGTQLPSRRDLARKLGVSQATISGAIRLLEQRGLVRTNTGSGTYVVDRFSSAFAESMQRLFQFSGSTLEDLIIFREMIEPSIATLAAKCAAPDDVAELRTILRQVDEAYEKGDGDASAIADAAFHQAVARATHNSLVIAVAAGLQEIMQSVLKTQDWEVILAYGRRDHRPILDAIVERDEKGARAAMAEHVSLFRLAMEKMAGRHTKPAFDTQNRVDGNTK